MKKKSGMGAVKLKRAIDCYFRECEENGRPPCISGLANALNIDKERLLSYGKDDAFFNIISAAKSRVFQALEERAIEKGNSGALFLLKNYGYSEKNTGEGGDITVEFNIPRPEKALSGDIKPLEDFSYED